MIKCAKDISPENVLGVMRTFALALNLINAAEVNHRLRNLRRSELEADMMDSTPIGPLPMVEDSVRGTIDAIMHEKKERGVSEEQTKNAIYDKLICQKVEIVLTAHPTEVNRRTVLRKCTCYESTSCFSSLTVSKEEILFEVCSHVSIANPTLLSDAAIPRRSQNYRNLGHSR